MSMDGILVVDHPVGRGCRICQQQLPWYETKPPDDEAQNPDVLRNVDYPFFSITTKSTMIQSRSTCWGPIYGVNRTVKSFIIINNIK